MLPLACSKKSKAPLQSCGAVSRLALLTMLAIVSVVVFVSVPRLRSFALHENESDARYIAGLLAAQLAQRSPAELAASELRIQDLASTPLVARALSDGDYLEHGGLLRRHGFLFRVVQVEGAEGHPARPKGTVLAGQRPVFAIQAWPWRHGRTGSATLLATDNGLIFRHPNHAGTWNGPLESKPRLSSWQGWSLEP